MRKRRKSYLLRKTSYHLFSEKIILPIKMIHSNRNISSFGKERNQNLFLILNFYMVKFQNMTASAQMTDYSDQVIDKGWRSNIRHKNKKIIQNKNSNMNSIMKTMTHKVWWCWRKLMMLCLCWFPHLISSYSSALLKLKLRFCKQDWNLKNSRILV